jgi:hypothetical protein
MSHPIKPSTLNMPTGISVLAGPVTALSLSFYAQKYGNGKNVSAGHYFEMITEFVLDHPNLTGLCTTALLLHYIRKEHHKEPDMKRRVVHALMVVGFTAVINQVSLRYFSP